MQWFAILSDKSYINKNSFTQEVMIDKNILLIDKPKGITSFDCIRILRKKLGIRKMGHAGTLDPLATGLMIIALNEGTKKLNEFLKLPKRYVAEILFGITTDTGDVTGKVLDKFPINLKDNNQILEFSNRIQETLTTMTGKIELPVPAYSAIKQGGEALYKKARRGEHIELPVKTMEITSATFLGFLHNDDGWCTSVEFEVGSGTYIRSVAQELGRRLGTFATLKNLRRTTIGNFSVDQAEKI
ncbi:MAG TPA: tRNA pseudouridine(55) synthase TruB [Candidatus Paceibacterota bacterium]